MTPEQEAAGLRRDNEELRKQLDAAQVQYDRRDKEFMEGYEQDIRTRDERVKLLEEQVIELRGRAAVVDDVMAQIRRITADQATWEVQSLQIKQKWEGLLQAARHELRLAQKDLTSGCGCPVGVCLGVPANDRMMACWKQWALSSAMVHSCNNHMDTLRSQAVHPARIAHVERNQS